MDIELENMSSDPLCQIWYWGNQRHRTDGPAIIDSTGYQGWWINGKNITEQVEQWMEHREIYYPWDESSQVEFLLTFL